VAELAVQTVISQLADFATFSGLGERYQNHSLLPLGGALVWPTGFPGRVTYSGLFLEGPVQLFCVCISACKRCFSSCGP
jgi:hypothetical protein